MPTLTKHIDDPPTVDLTALIVVTDRYEDLGDLYDSYSTGLRATGLSYEIIYVIDGQYPNVLEELRALAESDEAVKVLNLPRTYGEATSLVAGHEYAQGKLIITLPAFHQIDGRDIPKLVEESAKADIVVAKRGSRQDSLFTRIQSKVFSSLVNAISGLSLQDAGCTARVFDRKVFEEIELYGDFHRFLPVLAHKQGFTVREVSVRQDRADKKFRLYSPGVYLRRLLDLLSVYFIYRFTRKPFRFFGLIGAAAVIPGLIITTWLVIERLFFGVGLGDRPVFLFSTLAIVFGIQIACVGLIGEMIIFRNAKSFKEYRIQEIIHRGRSEQVTTPLDPSSPVVAEFRKDRA
ncbi:MAG: glycosyltransferase [Pseudomonadales bacterium]